MTDPAKAGERQVLAVEYDVSNGMARRVIIFTDGTEEVDYFRLVPAPAPAVTGLVAGLRTHIAALGVGCCSCGVKTFQPEYHDANCKVRNVAEALDNVDDLADALEALQAEMRSVRLSLDGWKHAAEIAEAQRFAAEAERDALKAEVERKDKALREAGEAITEYFRYLHGGETRGSYDGKPEREGLRKAGYAVSRALAPAKAGV